MNKVARDLSTAYHEAGHAVIAWRYGMYLRRVTIEPDEDSQGKLVGNLVAGIVKLDVGVIPPRVQRRVENYAVQALAGPAAQRRYNPRSHRWHHSYSDRSNVIDLLSYLCGPSSEEMSHYYALMDARARAAVRNPVYWRAIQVLARELIKRRTIKGNVLREFIRSDCFAQPGTGP